MKRRQKKKVIFSFIGGVSVGLIGAILLFFIYTTLTPSKVESSIKQNQPSSEVKKATIFPTIYVTGSSGKKEDMDRLLSKMFSPKELLSKKGLDILVNIKEKNKITVTGTISKENHYPIIEFETGGSTDKGELYSKALAVAMRYLVSHYQISAVNMLGYSSGGTGVMYYLEDYGQDKSLPPVAKFASLDGEYNGLTPLQKGETLEQVIAQGPKKQTPMYTYIAKNYKKIKPTTQVLLLEGNFSLKRETDNEIPWADTFSINHLLVNNGNSISMALYPTKLQHGRDTLNPIAANFIKQFFYSN